MEVGAFPLAQPQTPLPAPRAGKPTPRAAICFTSHQRADGALPSGVRRDFNPPPAPHRLLCIFCGYFPATKGTILLRREVGEEKHLLKHFFIPFPSMNWGPSSMRLEKKIKTLLKSPYFHDNDLFCVKVCRLHTERSAALCSQHHGQPLIRRERRGAKPFCSVSSLTTFLHPHTFGSGHRISSPPPQNRNTPLPQTVSASCRTHKTHLFNLAWLCLALRVTLLLGSCGMLSSTNLPLGLWTPRPLDVYISSPCSVPLDSIIIYFIFCGQVCYFTYSSYFI